MVPVERGGSVEDAFLGFVEGFGGGGVVHGKNLAFVDDHDAVDVGAADGAVAGGVDEAADGVPRGAHHGVGDVDHDHIGAAARCQATDVVAAQRLGAADGGSVEQVGAVHGAGVAGLGSGQVADEAELVEHVVRVGVGADAHVDPGAAVAAEILHGDAAAGEDGGAVGDGSAGFGQAGEVSVGVPAGAGVVIEEDAVAYNAAVGQEVHLVEPADGGDAVAAGDLVELDHGLGGVDLPGEAAGGGFLVAFAEQGFGAGVDLRGDDHAEQAAGGVLLGAVYEGQGLAHRFFAGGFVPFVLDAVAVLRGPLGGFEHGCDADAHAGFRQQVEPAGVGHREVGDGGDAGKQEFAKGDADAVGDGVGVGAEDGHVFVEGRVVEAGRADLVDEALVHGLAAGVAVDVDEAGHDHRVAAVDFVVDRPGVVAADVGDGAALEDDVGTGHVGVGAGVSRTVPGDEHIGVADDGGGGCGELHIGHGAYFPTVMSRPL